jgi:hypothetical protein
MARQQGGEKNAEDRPPEAHPGNDKTYKPPQKSSRTPTLWFGRWKWKMVNLMRTLNLRLQELAMSTHTTR